MQDDELGFLDQLDEAEKKAEEKRDGGGEAIDEGEDGCEGCKNLMDFSQALVEVKAGKKIARLGWNGKNQFVLKAGGYTVNEARPGSDYAKAGITGEFYIHPHLDLKNAQGGMAVGWVPSVGDLFAEDWVIVL